MHICVLALVVGVGWGLSTGDQGWPCSGASTMPDTLGSWEIVIYCESGSNIKLCINKNEVKDRIEFLMKAGKHRGGRT